MIHSCGYSIRMATTVRETAASVYTAFRRLPAKDRLAVIEKLLQDSSLRVSDQAADRLLSEARYEYGNGKARTFDSPASLRRVLTIRD
jgi:hypothetical protein